ncbi:MAG TPA: zf-HC2 domain-containing protein [Acidimicrobiales bacterium]|nr:zf-HC2 domain-containing protein [Acidimicrobiales bacterium]
MSAKPRKMWGTKEMASCMQVMRVVQSYLDGQTDQVTARRVANHLDACRRCGLEASTYREIKAALARQAAPLDEESLERLRAFGSSLSQQTARGEAESGSGDTSPPA